MQLRGGVTIGGIHYGAIEATLDRVQGSNLWLTFAIREGKNREVRNVLGHLGLTVTRLIRVSFGPFQLARTCRRRGRGGAHADCCANSSASKLGANAGFRFFSSGHDHAEVLPREAPPKQDESRARRASENEPKPHIRDITPGARGRMSGRRNRYGANFTARSAKTTNRPSWPAVTRAVLSDRKGRPRSGRALRQAAGRRNRWRPKRRPSSRRGRRAFDRASGPRPHHPKGRR